MAKKINSKSAVAAVETVVEIETTASRKVAPRIPMAIAGTVTDPNRKLTRDEWRALSPEEKRTRKDAKRANRPAVAARLAKNCDRLARRLGKMGQMLNTSNDGDAAIHGALLIAAANILVARDNYLALPSDWAPKTTSTYVAKGPKFAVGDTVAIHAKRRAAYDGLLSEAEMVSLKIVKVAGKRVVVVTEGMTRMFLPLNAIVKG